MKFLFDIDTWQEIYGSIRKNKLRTAITIIGVTWGIFLLVVLLGAARGMDNNFKKLFGDFATNSVFVWAQSTSMPFKGFQKGRRVRLTNKDVRAIRSEIKGVALVVPRNQTQGLVVRKFQTGNFRISGDYPELNLVQKKDMVWGRFINENDIKYKKKVCVVEEDVYKQLFEKDEYPIGQFVKINDINYKVVGVYRKSPTIQIGNDDFHIPFTTFQQVYNQGDKIGWMMITGKPEFDIKQMEADVKLLLRNMHRIHPDDKRAFGSFNLGEMFGKVTGFLTGMQFLTWFVGIATLIAGVFAIGNILLITVKERTKEIGIRRALGAVPIEIKRQVVLESIVLTLTAGMLGIIGGGLVLIGIDTAFGHGPDATLTNPTVNIPVILIAFATLMFLGTLIGLIPAQRAVSIKPIEALEKNKKLKIMSKSVKIILLSTFGILFLAVMVWFAKKNSKSPIEYKTETPFKATIINKAVATGKVIPEEEIMVKPQISGIIENIFVEEGAKVKKGNLIATVRVVPSIQALNSAKGRVENVKIQLENAKINYNRNKTLYKQGVISKADFERVELPYFSAQQDLKNAQGDLEIIKKGSTSGLGTVANTNILATMTGTILEIPVKEGDQVIQSNSFNSGTTIASIADLSKMIFEGKVDEAEVGKLKKGTDLKVSLGAIDKKEFKARLNFIAPKGTEENGAVQFKIKADVKLDSKYFIRAGYSANASIVLDRRDSVLSIKESLLKFDKKTEKPYVEVSVGDQKFERRDVELGLSDGINVEVLKGVKAKDKIKVWNKTKKDDEPKRGGGRNRS